MTTAPTGPDQLRAIVQASAAPGGREWLDEALAAIVVDPTTVRTSFPAARRHLGSDGEEWTAADAGRALLLLGIPAVSRADELAELYRFGDAHERRSVLLSLHLLFGGPEAVGYVHDAVRANDPRLVAAALGTYGARHLSDEEVAQATMKCIFMDIPLAKVEPLLERTTPELSRMVADFVRERIAAGRAIHADAWRVIDRYPPQESIAAIEAERASIVPERRHAAEAALSLRSPSPTS